MHDLTAAYSPERFRQQGHAIIDFLADCLAESLGQAPHDPQLQDTQRVVEMIDPDRAYDEFTSLFERSRNEPNFELKELFKHVYRRAIRLHNPQYLGHQISPPLPDAALASLMCDLMNNGMGVYEMGVGGTVMERFVIHSLARKIGYGESADGFLTSGGTLGNLTALVAARRAMTSYDAWQNGNQSRLALMVSDQAHYCIDKAARIMGWGEDGVIRIPTRQDFSMQTEALKPALEEARRKGLEVIAVVGSACSTATGTFDDLLAISKFCQQNKLWLHVDGAHGAATVYSSKYRSRVAGIECADSITMDFHKLLMTPALATALVFKDGRYAAQNFAQKADYLWAKSDEQDGDQTAWHDLAKRTFECTKSMVGFKVFTILAAHGEEVFDQNVTTLYESAASFADLIKSEPDLELAVEPQSNIVCFRFLADLPEDELNERNRTIRSRIVAAGHFYIVQTVLNGQAWLRCTIANPFTTVVHFESLLNTIRDLANSDLKTP